jgi:sulfatase maturation enzyme AslB (radical SAM superfamily)
MQVCSLTFILTENCNYRCSYCYQQKGNRVLKKSTIKNALEFFFPYLHEESYIHFYGGEPLLHFDLIEYAVNFIQDLNAEGKRTIRYTISTNGSLMNDEITNFLSQHQFSILLSFDGLAQDITKQKGSLGQIVTIIKKLNKIPSIELEINSVFTQKTIGYLTKSIQFINGLGVPKMEFALSHTIPWEKSQLTRLNDELENLRKMMLHIFRKTGKISLDNYTKNTSKGIFVCNAGRNRFDITPDGKLWGCSLFADYFKGKEHTEEYAKYCYGDLHSFIKQHDTVYPEILLNYSGLQMDRYFTSDTLCAECSNLYSCGACPADNLLSCSNARKIAWWDCEIKKILMKNKEQFWEEMERQT